MHENLLVRLKEKIKIWRWGTLIIVPFLAIGLLTLSLSCYYSYKSSVSENWLQIPARVVNTEMYTHVDSKNSKTTEILVKYTYLIKKKEYTNNKLAFGYSQSNLNDDSRLFNLLENANKVVVYVNPKDSNESVISTGLNDSIIFLILFATIWNTVLICSFLSFCFEKHKNKIGCFIFLVIIGCIFILMSGLADVDFINKIKVLEYKKESSYYIE